MNAGYVTTQPAPVFSPQLFALALRSRAVVASAGTSCRPGSTSRYGSSFPARKATSELYVGILVWNRLRYVKDPDTKRHHSRANSEQQIVRAAVPDWRVVDDALWYAVKDRQAGLDALRGGQGNKGAFWKQQRPTYLLSGLLCCHTFGGGMAMISATHLGCSKARNKGEAVCVNRRTVQRTYVEDKVLGALAHHMMPPDIYAAFVREFMSEWNMEQRGRAVEQDAMRGELKRINQKIDNFISAIGLSGGSPAIISALKDAEARKVSIEAELATAVAPAPRLLPNLAELNR